MENIKQGVYQIKGDKAFELVARKLGYIPIVEAPKCCMVVQGEPYEENNLVIKLKPEYEDKK